MKREALLPADVITKQMAFGPQSTRGGMTLDLLKMLEGNPHAVKVFETFMQNEKKLCGEFAVFYHSYSFSALLYELYAAVGSVLFRFRSQYATLPRLLVHQFQGNETADQLRENLKTKYTARRDGDHEYRKAG